MPCVRLLTPLLGLGVCLVLPGCVVWDIKDGIGASNDNLVRIEENLNSIDEGLGQTNENLGTVEQRLTSMDERLDRLQSQLDATNKHLESLRKTINSIDSTIPFLKLSGDDEQEREELKKGDQSPHRGPQQAPSGAGGS